MRAFALLLLALLAGPPPDDLVVAFERLPSDPQSLPYRSDLDVDRRDGHLQGIQRLGDRYLVSGSSDRESYLVVLAPDDRAQYLRLSGRPLTHAGGFQVNDGLLAIGIEDADSRARSAVEIYDISDVSRSPSLQDGPITTISRQGEPERMTAGAVGVARFGGDVLVVVGSWDSRHLDFYRSPRTEPTPDYELYSTLTASALSRAGWSDPEWHSYQNLNLFVDGESLYLLGTASSGEENVADLFGVELVGERVAGLHKISSTRFDLPSDVQFRWGAGAWRLPDGGLELGVTEEDLRRGGAIMLFHARP